MTLVILIWHTISEPFQHKFSSPRGFQHSQALSKISNRSNLCKRANVCSILSYQYYISISKDLRVEDLTKKARIFHNQRLCEIAEALESNLAMSAGEQLCNKASSFIGVGRRHLVLSWKISPFTILKRNLTLY